MNDIYQTAINAFVKGRYKEAHRICKNILKRQPASHEALHLLAMTEKRRGKYSLAIKTFNKALRLAPSTPMYWNNLGETYREMGDPDKAIKCYQKAVKCRPEYAEACSNWGAALMMKGDTGQAEQQLLRAVEINPKLVNAIYNLGVLYIDTDAPELARQAFERTLGVDNSNIDALVNLAYLDKNAGDLKQAQRHCQRALEIEPTHFEAQMHLANIYFDREQYREAAERYRKASEIRPKELAARLGLGHACMKSGYYHDAEEAFRRAISIAINSGEAILGMANAALMKGELETAVVMAERYRKAVGMDSQYYELLAEASLRGGEFLEANRMARSCLEMDPNNVAAYDVMTQVNLFLQNDADMKRMIDLYAGDKLTGKQRISLAFSIARALEKTGDFDAAFDYLAQGNRLRSEAVQHGADDAEKSMELIGQIQSLFSAGFLRMHDGHGCVDAAPIFIVGLPRTGKTVTESLLGRNSRITKGGELRYFGDTVRSLLKSERFGVFPGGIRNLEARHFKSIGEKYIKELQRRFKDGGRVINTLPGNAFEVGMIRLCLPQAKVFWVERSLRDACFEMYRKNLPMGNEYANDLRTLGEYAVRFNGLMEYWSQLLPGFFYKVKFDDLIADPEKQLKVLLDYCGLEWDDVCLGEVHMEQAGGPGPATMPTPENAIGVWRPYEKYLSPLFDAIEKHV